MGRDRLVDRLKGYACFLVLFGHVIMGVRVAGVPVPTVFRGLEQVIWSFHVALFLFLSGVVYRMTGEWRSKGTRGGFVRHKLLTLGVPYVTFSAVYILINSFVGQANTQFSPWDILAIWKTPVAQYWFLYALFFLFCIWAALSGRVKNWQITLVAVALSYLIPLCGVRADTLVAVLYAALSFGMGTVVDFAALTKPTAPIKWLAVAAHLGVGALCVVGNCIEAPFVKECVLLLGIYASIQFISVVQGCKPVGRFLDFMNKYSFQIYLLHTIFTAGIRIVLLRVGVTQWWIHVPVGVAVGIACSVLAAEIARRVKFLNFFFFPTKIRK